MATLVLINTGKKLHVLHGIYKASGKHKTKVTAESFESYKVQFLYDIRSIFVLEEIPSHLIVNWDHTGLNYAPVSNWIMTKEGSKKVEIVGINDKRQIIAVFGCTLHDDFLPP